MDGYRKLIITVLSLVAFTFIMVKAKVAIDPLSLGVGLGMLLFPTSAANAVEHIAKSRK